MATADEINITIAGDSAPLVTALADAGTAFGDMAVAAGASTTDIAASMEALASVIEQLAAEVDVLAASMDSLAASSGTAAAGVGATGAAAGSATAETLSFGDAIGVLTGAFDALFGSITPLLATFGTLIAVMGAMTIINDVSNWVQNLITQMFQLDQQTQKTVNSWQYLFATTKGGGKAAAQSLAAWAYQESPNLPFTAMDLRSAISTLGTAGYTAQQIEQFIPYLADIASTLGTAAYGGQGVTLEQAAMAIRSAGFGLTRMLRTDLGISPAQLIPYGLAATVGKGGAVKIKDMSTLIPALEAFTQGRGLAGAAQEQEVNTFWGAWSSFQDYLQNWMQTAGGINPQTGQVEKGSMFGGLQQILVGINSVLGQAQAAGTGGKGATIGGLTGVLGNILGGGVQSFISLFEGITGGAGAAGAVKVINDLFDALKRFGEWLQSAPIQADIKQIGEAIGQVLGANLRSVQAAMPDLVNSFRDLWHSIQTFWNSFTPQQRASIGQFAGQLVELAAVVVELAANFTEGVAVVVTDWNRIIAAIADPIKQLIASAQNWGRDLVNMLVQGIMNAMPNLQSGVNFAAGIISKVFQHSRPEQGPLVGDDQWMPHMMHMFASDIERSIPALVRASQMAAAAIGTGLHGHGGGGYGYGVGGGVSNTYGATTNYGGGNTANLNMYGASQVQLESVIMGVLQRMDRIGALTQAQPGGMFLFGMH